MSRQEVADAANDYLWINYQEQATLDRNYIGKLEQGKHRWPQRRHREALRYVLNVMSDAELGFFIIRGEGRRSAPNPAVGAVADCVNGCKGESGVNRRELLMGIVAPGMGALIAAVADRFVTDHSLTDLPKLDHLSLAARLTKIRRAYQHSQYESAADALPSLLIVLQHQRERCRSSELARVDAQAHQVASALLLKNEHPVLAAVAAERSMVAAREAGDALTVASSARAMVHSLMASGQPRSAAELAAHAADQLSRAVNLDEASAVSLYGALLLRGAIAAARLEDYDQAQALLGEASRAAHRLGRDGNLHWTAFGPTNVAVHRIAVAVEVGDAGAAVRLAEALDMTKLELPERKAMLLLDTARALTQWGKWERAFEAIRRAERYAPEEVRTRPAAHAVIHELASRAPDSLRRNIYTYALAVGATK